MGVSIIDTALGIDFASLVGPNQASGFTSSLPAVATDGPLEDCTTPIDAPCPIPALDAVPFIAATASGFACTNHPLGSGSLPITCTATPR